MYREGMCGEAATLIKCCHRTDFSLAHQTYIAEVFTAGALIDERARGASKRSIR